MNCENPVFPGRHAGGRDSTNKRLYLTGCSEVAELSDRAVCVLRVLCLYNLVKKEDSGDVQLSQPLGG